MNNPNKIITHHALSSKTHTVQDVQKWHFDRWPGFVSSLGFNVGYHYVIEWDGTVTQTREHWEEGAHCIGQNKSSIGVCFMGNFDLHGPSKEQMSAWKKLYAKIYLKHPNLTRVRVYPHRKYASKSCHGSLLPDNHFSAVLGPSKKELRDQLEDIRAQLIKLLSLLTNKRV